MNGDGYLFPLISIGKCVLCFIIIPHPSTFSGGITEIYSSALSLSLSFLLFIKQLAKELWEHLQSNELLKR